MRYPHGQITHPLGQSVLDTVAGIALADDAMSDNVFMKVGASGTVYVSFLKCFAGDNVDLDGRDALEPALDYFLAGDADGTDPFSRSTLAASIGKSAGWAITGDPSPLEQEMAALQPRFAFTNYGANDMQLGTTHESALWGSGDKYWRLIDQLIASGVVPIVTLMLPRTDLDTAPYWVPTYNMVSRGIAQARQVPLLDLWLAVQDLDGYGLSGDGLHANTSPNGACVFTPAGLAYGYNVRNLISLEALERMRQVITGDLEAEPSEPITTGTGGPDDPFIVELPFTHSADTSASTFDAIDTYDCGPQDESAPRVYYELTLTETTALRALVVDKSGTDVDIHLLSRPNGDACLARGHHIVQGTFAPGTYYIVVDGWVSAAGSNSAANMCSWCSSVRRVIRRAIRTRPGAACRGLGQGLLAPRRV